MSKAQVVRDYVAKNPRVTGPELIEALRDPHAHTRATQAVKAGALLADRELRGGKMVTVYFERPAAEALNVIVKPLPTEPAVPKVAAPVRPSLDAMVDDFSGHLVEAILARVEAGLIARLPAAIPRLVESVVVPAPPAQGGFTGKPEERMKHIAVVGVTPQQIAIIKGEFGGSADMYFWSSDGKGDGDARLKQLGISSDKVFLNVGMVGHKHVEMLKSVGANMQRFGGGMTQLREMLKHYLKQEAS